MSRPTVELAVKTLNDLGHWDGRQYLKGSCCLQALLDLIYCLRRDGEDLAVRVALGEAQLVHTHLLPLLVQHGNGNTELLSTTLKLLVQLTHHPREAGCQAPEQLGQVHQSFVSTFAIHEKKMRRVWEGLQNSYLHSDEVCSLLDTVLGLLPSTTSVPLLEQTVQTAHLLLKMLERCCASGSEWKLREYVYRFTDTTILVTYLSLLQHHRTNHHRTNHAVGCLFHCLIHKHGLVMRFTKPDIFPFFSVFEKVMMDAEPAARDVLIFSTAVLLKLFTVADYDPNIQKQVARLKVTKDEVRTKALLLQAHDSLWLATREPQPPSTTSPRLSPTISELPLSITPPPSITPPQLSPSTTSPRLSPTISELPLSITPPSTTSPQLSPSITPPQLSPCTTPTPTTLQLTPKQISLVMCKVREAGLEDAVRWVAEELESAAQNRLTEVAWEPAPLRISHTHHLDALCDQSFIRLLLMLGLQPPCTHQDLLWTIPACLSPVILFQYSHLLALNASTDPGDPATPTLSQLSTFTSQEVLQSEPLSPSNLVEVQAMPLMPWEIPFITVGSPKRKEATPVASFHS